MSSHFTGPSGYIVAEVAIETNGINGIGGAQSPALAVTLQVLFRCPKDPGTTINFRELRCRVSPFEGTYFALSLPVYLNYRLTPGTESSGNSVYMEIPLDQRRLALLNRLRKGGDVKLRLDLELLADELVEIARPQNPPGTSIWGLKEHHRMFSKVPAEIPRSKWIEQVLPQTEFAKIHILELPAIPLESCAAMKAAFDALQHAYKLESQGFYDDAVAKCRVALEPFFERAEIIDDKGEKRKVPILKSSWQTQLGRVTYDWLNAALIAMKRAADEPHHLSSSSFGQLEAQMLLAVTTSLIAYAVK